MATLNMETLCAFVQTKQQENNLTFPKWIICTGELMASRFFFFFQPVLSKGVGVDFKPSHQCVCVRVYV